MKYRYFRLTTVQRWHIERAVYLKSKTTIRMFCGLVLYRGDDLFESSDAEDDKVVCRKCISNRERFNKKNFSIK